MLFLFCLIAAQASSQPTLQPSSLPVSEGAELETIVTGSRSPRLIGEGAVRTEVIKRKDIEATGSENLAGVLQNYAGVDVTRSFAGAGIRIQGFDPQYILVLVDGERISGRVNGTIDLTRFAADDIERVEIIRGPSSALYGSDALGGVINIITRRAKKKLELDAHTRYGFGSILNPMHAFDANGKVASKLGAFNLKLTGGFHRANPWDRVPSDRATTGNGFWQGDVSGRVSYRTKNNSEIALRTEYVRREQNGIDISGSNALLARFNSTETFAVSLAPDIVLSDTGTLRVLAGYNLFRDQFLLDQRGSTQLDQYQENRQHLGQLQLIYTQHIAADHTLVVGAEAFYERNLSERLVTGAADRFRSGVFAQHEWYVWREPLVLVTTGLRLDGDTQFGAQPTPKIALRVDPIKSLTLRFSYGWGYRAPSFQELYILFNNASVGYTVSGNPSLRPELSQSINLGGEWTPAPWVTLTLNLYRNELENLITALTSAPGNASSLSLFSYANIAKARLQGIETTVQFRPISGMKIDAAYTLTDARDLDKQRALDQRAPHRFNLSFGYTHEGIGLGGLTRASLVTQRPFYFDDNGDLIDETQIAPAYVSWDVRVTKTIGRHIDVFVGVDNIMDAGDQRFLPIPPRLFYAGLNGRY
jgi:outer membrane receptor for ferrienterochelin and colicins